MTTPLVSPQGRLTLTSGVPVLITDVTAATTVYYTPYKGNSLSLPDFYTGVWSNYVITELSLALSDTIYSAAATTANNNYDMFAGIDSDGFVRLFRGPAWTSATARATGLSRINGFLVNAANLTNGPLAYMGLYLGTFRTNASNQVDMMFAPAAAAGGTQNRLYLWNMYNREDIAAINRDSTASWAYTTATLRARNGNANSEISFVCGLAEDAFYAINIMCSSQANVSFNRYSSIGYDATNSVSSRCSIGRMEEGALTSAAPGGDLHKSFLFMQPTLGSHFICPQEISAASGTATWYGETAQIQSAIMFFWKM